MIIGIDVGHGGKDPGAVGRTLGTKESDIVLGISLELQKILKSKGVDVVVTRNSDVFLTLSQRTNILNQNKVNYAVSIHINAANNRSANYVSTFIQTKGGEAEKLANIVQSEMTKEIGWSDGGLRVQNLYMTRMTNMPAILVECGFISNAEQEKELRKPEVQKKFAKAIANGILEHIGKEVEQVAEWKTNIMQEAHKLGLIDLAHGHKADDVASKWFVLAIAINLYKLLKKLLAT